MLLWLRENLSTILISAGLLLVVIAIIRSMVKDKKQGKSSCEPTVRTAPWAVAVAATAESKKREALRICASRFVYADTGEPPTGTVLRCL